jgi:hypothetical protein
LKIRSRARQRFVNGFGILDAVIRHVNACLLIIGLTDRSASPAVRERFWIEKGRRYETLIELRHSDAIDEVVLLVTNQRTEFILWASEPGVAANSVLSFLTQEYGLRQTEWQSFYRKLECSALLHLFRVASGLDSALPGNTVVGAELQAAWQLARRVGTVGPFLDAVLEKAQATAARAHAEMASVLTGRTQPGELPVAEENRWPLAIACAEKLISAEVREFRTSLADCIARSQASPSELPSGGRPAGALQAGLSEAQQALLRVILSHGIGENPQPARELVQSLGTTPEQIAAAVRRLFDPERARAIVAGSSQK